MASQLKNLNIKALQPALLELVTAKEFQRAVRLRIKKVIQLNQNVGEEYSNEDMREDLNYFVNEGVFNILDEKEYEQWAAIKGNRGCVDFAYEFLNDDNSMSRVDIIEMAILHRIEYTVDRIMDARGKILHS